MLTTTLFRTLITNYSKLNTINITTFDKFLMNLDLCDEYHNHNVNKVKGFVFESLVKYYYVFKHAEVYLFNEIPPIIKETFNLSAQDKGVDIVYKENDTWIPVQCKWKKAINTVIDKNQILGFIEEAKEFTTKVLVSNVRKKSKYICDRYNIDWIMRTDLERIVNRDFINFIVDKVKFDPNQIMKHQQNIVLRECQKDALKALTESDSTKKQCIMFCGTGKSIVMIEYIKTKNVDRVLVLMPSLQLINQFYNNMKHHTKTKILCICSKFDKGSLTGDDENEDDDEVDDETGNDLLDEYLKLESGNISYTTKPATITRLLKRKKIIVLCTYQSSRLLKGHKFDLGLFDEAHTTVNSNTFGFALDDNNCHINERVFFTATPKYYKGNDEKCISMNNVSIYGEEVFNYKYIQAKNDGYVLDFRIVAYAVPENMNDLTEEEFITQDEVDIKKEILISAILIAQHIKKTNTCRKILTYHDTIANAVEYKKTLAYVLLKYNISAKIFAMCGNTSMMKRKEIFNEYETSEIAIICSAKVLNTGVDLPCTDTIAFVDPRSSTIDVTQCVGRGLRLYGEQKICDIIIPIHYDHVKSAYNYNDLIKILMAMREIDNELIANFVNKNANNKIEIVQMNINEISDHKSEIQVKYDFEEVMQNLTTFIIASRVLGFEYNMNILFKYCNENKCAPQVKTIFEYKKIGSWYNDQKKNIKNKDNKLYIKLSENEYIKKSLDDYLINVEINKTRLDRSQWIQLLFKYCDKNQCVPTREITFEDNNLGRWFKDHKRIIKDTDNELYKLLSENKYVKKGLDNYLNPDNIWNEHVQLLFKYCNKYQRFPLADTTFEGKNIGTWFSHQKPKIKSTNDELYKLLSKNKYIKKALDNYLRNVNKNKEKTKLDRYQWIQLLFKFCGTQQCVPSREMSIEGNNIGRWFENQKPKIKSTNDELYKLLSKNKYIKKALDNYLRNSKKRKKTNYESSEDIENIKIVKKPIVKPTIVRVRKVIIKSNEGANHTISKSKKMVKDMDSSDLEDLEEYEDIKTPIEAVKETNVTKPIIKPRIVIVRKTVPQKESNDNFGNDVKKKNSVSNEKTSHNISKSKKIVKDVDYSDSDVENSEESKDIKTMKVVKKTDAKKPIIKPPVKPKSTVKSTVVVIRKAVPK